MELRDKQKRDRARELLLWVLLQDHSSLEGWRAGRRRGRRPAFLLNTTAESSAAPPPSSGTTSTTRVTATQGGTASGFTPLLGNSALLSTLIHWQTESTSRATMTEKISKKQGFKKCRSATFSIDGFSFTIGERLFVTVWYDVCVYARVCVCVCVCVRERERGFACHHWWCWTDGVLFLRFIVVEL